MEAAMAGAFASTRLELALAIIAGALGSLVGDHIVYWAGSRGGESLRRSTAHSPSARSDASRTR